MLFFFNQLFYIELTLNNGSAPSCKLHVLQLAAKGNAYINKRCKVPYGLCIAEA